MGTHVVTGAGSGIGAAVARALTHRGNDLVLLARSEERAQHLTEDFRGARVIVADLAEPSMLAEALAGQLIDAGIDSLIHSAGVFEFGAVSDLTTEVWRRALDVNLLGPAELTRLCLPALRSVRGHVVFINSGATWNAGSHKSAYAASKFGLRALADSLRGEEREFGLRVTSVYPGRTATPMQATVHAHEGRQYVPSDWMSADSVAEAVMFALDLPSDAEIVDLTVRPVH
jgi:short-subunit dehydrogenase